MTTLHHTALPGAPAPGTTSAVLTAGSGIDLTLDSVTNTLTLDVIGGGGAGSLTLIDKQQLLSDTTTITFSSIPGTYSHLRVMALGRITQAATDDYVYVRFNGDTGANYDEERFVVFGTSTNANQAFGQTKARIADFPGASAPANLPGSFDMFIPHYAGAVFEKIATIESGGKLSTSSNDLYMRTHQIAWRSTAALTSIELSLASGDFLTGSIFSLYGIE